MHPVMEWQRISFEKRVGWVERLRNPSMATTPAMGFATLNPSYAMIAEWRVKENPPYACVPPMDRGMAVPLRPFAVGPSLVARTRPR
jgi:hypothetical protein